MALRKIREVRGCAVPLPGDDIDTDRIIPARFLKCVTFDGLGEALFYDERFTEQGQVKPHPLNDPHHRNANILVSGSNFGCGSSREHAPQSIVRAGFQAIVAESYGEIFFGNATTLGMVCMSVSPEVRRELIALLDADPELELTIEIESEQIRAGGRAFNGHLPPSVRQAFLEGYWDPLDELLEGVPAVRQIAARIEGLTSGS